ncbi:MAG: hypothetical protein RL095_3636 [Verrucomicrobiota bacterium]|jgi:LysR family hydrogen peroxide-inducible transcriptional activator
MNLRLFEAIAAIEETGSISAAAEKCGVSQPALSGQIKGFEEELGVSLIERGRRGVLLTPAGREILRRAQEVLRCVKEVRQLAEGWGNPYSGKMLLGAFPTLAPYLFPKIMTSLQEAYPEIDFYLRESKTADLIRQLLAGELDAAFIAAPIEEDLVASEEIFTEPFLLLAPPDSPWRLRKQVKLKELSSDELLILEEGHCLGAQILDFCSSGGLVRHADFRGSSLGTLMAMVRLGRGYTLVPECALASADPACTVLPVVQPGPGRSIHLCWRRTSPRHEVFREIADEVRRLLRK